MGSLFGKALLGAGTLFLCVYVVATPPFFSNDSQYYIQSGLLWADGKVSYAASLVGSRVFAIFFYHAFVRLFGPSIDSISIALGFSFLCFSCACWALVRAEGMRSWLQYLAATTLTLIGFGWMEWYKPLTDQFQVTVSLLALAAYRASLPCRSDRKRLSWLCAAAAICGMGTGFRSELLLLFACMCLGNGLRGIVALRVGATAAGALASILVYVASSTTPLLGFRAFTGTELPAQLTGYLLFYRPVELYGDRANGPASAELFQLGEGLKARSPEVGDLNPIRLGGDAAYVTLGARHASDLYFAAGLEALGAHPREAFLSTAAAASYYLFDMPGKFILTPIDVASTRAETKITLEGIDSLRSQVSKIRFGGDYTWPVATIADKRLVSGGLLDRVPIYHLQSILPAWLLTSLGVLAVLAGWRTGGWGNPALVAFVYYVGNCILAATSQGFVERYWLSASLPLLAVSVCTLIAVTGRYFRLDARFLHNNPS